MLVRRRRMHASANDHAVTRAASASAADELEPADDVGSGARRLRPDDSAGAGEEASGTEEVATVTSEASFLLAAGVSAFLAVCALYAPSALLVTEAVVWWISAAIGATVELVDPDDD